MKKQPPIKEYIEDPCARLREENATLKAQFVGTARDVAPHTEEIQRLRDTIARLMEERDHANGLLLGAREERDTMGAALDIIIERCVEDCPPSRASAIPARRYGFPARSSFASRKKRPG
jgi:hypothetical protein